MEIIKTVEQAYERLVDEFNNINSNQAWLQFLQFQARLYNYSFRNVLLIAAQAPYASFVAGYSAWNRLGRQVRKGEKSLKIFAPIVLKKLDDTTKQEKTVVTSFRLASVFDVSQTLPLPNAKPIPAVIGGIAERGKSDENLFWQIADATELPVRFNDSMDAKGCYLAGTKVIEINPSYSWTQRVKTLIHEFAHYLHDNHLREVGRTKEELIAESVAYVFCQWLGLDSAEYSLPYLRSWTSDPDVLWECGSTIQILSNRMITQITAKTGSQMGAFLISDEKEVIEDVG